MIGSGTFLLLWVQFTALRASNVNQNLRPKGLRYEMEHIPNPMTLPSDCGRPGVERSIICDVSNLLSKESKDVIEGRAMDVEGAEFGVAIISQMIPPSGVSDIDESARLFATRLHNSWGVGDKEKQNGVLIFISVKDRAVYISRGSGLQKFLSDHTLDLLIEHMKPYLREGDYGKAVEATIVEIDLITHNKPSAAISRSQSSPDNSGIGGVIMFLAIAGCVFYFAHRQNLHERGLRRGQLALSQLIRDVESSEDNRFEFTSCPICLEDFELPPGGGDREATATHDATGGIAEGGASAPSGNVSPGSSFSSSEPSPLRPMALHCGHTFCFKCLQEYLKDRNSDKKCPICRAPVDPAAPQPPRPAQDPAPRSPPGVRSPPGLGSSGSDNPSCSSSSMGGDGTQHTHTSNRTFSSSSFRMRRTAPEVLYRMRRMRFLYPTVMTASVYNSLERAVEAESPAEFVRAASHRAEEVSKTLADIAKRNAAAKKGSGGAKSSFGGGRSGGGRGGRW
jgi:uncharacterized membrane protein YgcG